MTYAWHEAYQAAVLETDWTTMHERLQSAEDAIIERQRVLSMDHNGTPEERQAIVDALRGITSLRIELGSWQNQQLSRDEGALPN